MPSLLYRARHEPPTVEDHVYAHAPLLSIAVAGLAVALMMIVTSAVDELTLAPALDVLPPWTGFLVGGILVAGALTTIGGILISWGTLTVTLAVYRVGLVLLSLGLAGWSIALMKAPPPVFWSSVAFSGILGVGILVELWATFPAERGIRATVADTRRKISEAASGAHSAGSEGLE